MPYVMINRRAHQKADAKTRQMLYPSRRHQIKIAGLHRVDNCPCGPSLHPVPVAMHLPFDLGPAGATGGLVETAVGLDLGSVGMVMAEQATDAID